ncbi:MAG TPA: citrate/2-methylcitrate synthase [Acidimicrobiales bacterium]
MSELEKDLDRDRWHSPVSTLADGSILIRGYPIAELIEHLAFSEAAYLVIRGELPSPADATLFDACLCAILDYAMGPAPYAARVVASANPQLGPALAAGVLAQGAYAVSPQEAGEFIAQALHTWRSQGESVDGAAAVVVDEVLREGRRIPGFGRPSNHGPDERAAALERVIRSSGKWGDASELYTAVHRRWLDRSGKELVINVDGMLAVALTELGFRPVEMGGVAALSFLPGIIANAVEEITSGVKIRQIPGLRYTGPKKRHLDDRHG